MDSESEGSQVGGKAVKKKASWWRPVVLVAAIATVIVLARVFGLDEKLDDFREWIKGQGALGPVIFIAVYIAGVVAALPGGALTIAAGALFGSAVGIISVSVASTTGASLAFLISRYFLRGTVTAWLGKKEKFRQLDTLSERHGAIIVAITRLVPLFPFNLLNYGLGLTRVRFWTYVFWSWLCMLPMTVVYVVGADVLVKGIAEGRVPWLLIVLLVVVIGVLTLLIRAARRRLKSEEAAEQTAGASGKDGSSDE